VSEFVEQHEPIWDGLKIVLFSVVFGCPIGGFFFGIGLLVQSIFQGHPFSISEIITALTVFTLFSYAIGFAPALCSSIGISIYAWVFKKLTTLGVIIISFVILMPIFFAVVTQDNLPDIVSYSEVAYLIITWLTACSLVATYLSYRLYYNWLSISKLHSVSGGQKEIA
jgi:hypothetical protein